MNRWDARFINPQTLANFSASCWKEILGFHSELASDDFVRATDTFYRKSFQKYGNSWFHLDIVNVLYAAAKLHQPKNYLEVGVRRGRSCAVVSRGFPEANIYACDMWIDNYAGMENPGPDFVKKILKEQGHRGDIFFFNGDSRIVLPELFKLNSSLEFDLITIDGDHSFEGAYNDLCTAIPRLASNGIIVFDDIVHPSHSYLLNAWRDVMTRFPNLLAYEYIESGYGIAFAVNQAS